MSVGALLKLLLAACYLADARMKVDLAGKVAALTEAGYEQVAASKNDEAMGQYVRRFLKSNKKMIKSDDDLNGLIPWYSGVQAKQSLAQLKSELFSKPWVYDEPQPVIIPVTSVASQRDSGVQAEQSLAQLKSETEQNASANTTRANITESSKVAWMGSDAFSDLYHSVMKGAAPVADSVKDVALEQAQEAPVKSHRNVLELARAQASDVAVQYASKVGHPLVVMNDLLKMTERQRSHAFKQLSKDLVVLQFGKNLVKVLQVEQLTKLFQVMQQLHKKSPKDLQAVLTTKGIECKDCDAEQMRDEIINTFWNVAHPDDKTHTKNDKGDHSTRATADKHETKAGKNTKLDQKLERKLGSKQKELAEAHEEEEGQAAAAEAASAKNAAEEVRVKKMAAEAAAALKDADTLAAKKRVENAEAAKEVAAKNAAAQAAFNKVEEAEVKAQKAANVVAKEAKKAEEAVVDAKQARGLFARAHWALKAANVEAAAAEEAAAKNTKELAAKKVADDADAKKADQAAKKSAEAAAVAKKSADEAAAKKAVEDGAALKAKKSADAAAAKKAVEDAAALKAKKVADEAAAKKAVIDAAALKATKVADEAAAKKAVEDAAAVKAANHIAAAMKAAKEISNKKAAAQEQQKKTRHAMSLLGNKSIHDAAVNASVGLPALAVMQAVEAVGQAQKIMGNVAATAQHGVQSAIAKTTQAVENTAEVADTAVKDTIKDSKKAAHKAVKSASHVVSSVVSKLSGVSKFIWHSAESLAEKSIKTAKLKIPRTKERIHAHQKTSVQAAADVKSDHHNNLSQHHSKEKGHTVNSSAVSDQQVNHILNSSVVSGQEVAGMTDGCNWNCYLQRYPALKMTLENLVQARNHYIRVGRAAGRNCKCNSKEEERAGLQQDHPAKTNQAANVTKPAEKQQITITFMPGMLGISANWYDGGVVDRVLPDTQAGKAHVKIGWAVKAVDGAPYEELVLDRKRMGKKPYAITFEAPLEKVASATPKKLQEHDVSFKTLQQQRLRSDDKLKLKGATNSTVVVNITEDAKEEDELDQNETVDSEEDEQSEEVERETTDEEVEQREDQNEEEEEQDKEKDVDSEEDEQSEEVERETTDEEVELREDQNEEEEQDKEKDEKEDEEDEKQDEADTLTKDDAEDEETEKVEEDKVPTDEEDDDLIETQDNGEAVGEVVDLVRTPGGKLLHRIEHRLPSARVIMDKPTKVFSKLTAQLSDLRAHLDEAAAEEHVEAHHRKAEYEAALEEQRSNTSAIRSENKRIKNELMLVNGENHELREHAMELQSRSEELKNELAALQGDMTTSQEYAQLSVKASADNDSKLQILRDLEAKEEAFSEKQTHKENLQTQMMEDDSDDEDALDSLALLQVEDEPVDTLDYVRTLGANWEHLDEEEQASLEDLKAEFDKEMTHERNEQFDLIAEQESLIDRRTGALTLKKELDAAVNHLELTKSHIRDNLDELKGFLTRVGGHTVSKDV